MSGVSELLYCDTCGARCPKCLQDITAEHPSWLCPECGTRNQVNLGSISNPLSFGLFLKAIGFVARILIKSGALESVDAYAEKTENQVDDFAARVARSLVEQAAKL